jgi:hypothetical protein
LEYRDEVVEVKMEFYDEEYVLYLDKTFKTIWPAAPECHSKMMNLVRAYRAAQISKEALGEGIDKLIEDGYQRELNELRK